MPEKIWVFDTVALSNFLLSDSIFILWNFKSFGVGGANISGKS
jgi:hypothetical protein